MSMTVDQMILLSRLFLGAMIILTIVAAVLFLYLMSGEPGGFLEVRNYHQYIRIKQWQSM